jgi:hypothetical protein
MLKIDPHSNTLLSLGRRTLQAAPLFERYSVSDLVANSPDVFFADLGRAFFFLGRSVLVSQKTGRRADLLLLDPEGRIYIGRLQEGKQRVDLVDALEDAGCVSHWGPERILALLDEERREMLERAFLKAPLDRINHEQGVLLLAESYDLDTMASAGWLKARYGVRIDCYQLRLATDSLTQIEYLSCQDLNRHVDRVYQRRKSAEPDGAPWPAAAVPDISDGPRPAKKPPPAPAPSTEQVKPPPPAASEPEPIVAKPEPAPEPARKAEAAPPPVVTPEPERAPKVVQEPPAKPASPLEAEVEAALGDADQDEIFFTGELSPEEDPLADIIAGQEAKEAGEEPEAPPASDRRGSDRSRDYQARRLRLDYFGRLLGARLVDFSTSGLGVEALSPLPVGAEIGISGEIISESGTVGIEGRAKVEHCRSTQDGVCRIGFSLDKAVISEIADPESFDRR